MARRPKLRLVSSSSRSKSPVLKAEPLIDRPIVRAGGLFSSVMMPIVEEDAIDDPDIFFTLPDTLSLLKEQIELGNLSIIAMKTGLEQREISDLLNVITINDSPKLRKIRMCLGVQRARANLTFD
jgi:hypothetical protein